MRRAGIVPGAHVVDMGCGPARILLETFAANDQVGILIV
jgi:ubiquinone/menaquinone biosynthesis C-methylase UbiE